MNVKNEFLDWMAKKTIYPNLNINTLTERYISFLEFNPFEVKDDYSDIEEIKRRILSKDQDLKQNKEYNDFQDKSSNGAPRAILGRENYFVFLDGIKPKPGKDIFKKIINNWKEKFGTESILKVTKESQNHAWLGDLNNKIGQLEAHYEAIIINKNKVSVDIHFEGNHKEAFHLKLNGQNQLPENIIWIRWQGSQSIRYNKPIDIDDVEVVEKINNQLIILEENFGDKIRDILNSSVNETKKKRETVKQDSLNQILFGPPGTGKTYNTINKSLAIIEGKNETELILEPRSELKKRFNNYVNEGQIVFTTFHQSMSYEDFIEGIKPQKPELDDTFLKYDIEPGIFKSICNKAKKIKLEVKQVDWDKPKYYKMSLGGKNRPDLHDWCIENNVIALGWGDDCDLLKVKDITDWKDYRDTFIKEYPQLVKDSKFNIQATYAFINMKENDIVVISKGNHIIDAIGIIKGEYYWDDKNPVEFFHYRKVEWVATNMKVSPDRFIRKQISQMSIYEFYPQDIIKEAFKEISSPSKNNTEKPFVLIIDEINRGNVSQIFGELITLIEDDKRLGKDEELEVVLPYSKEKFGVPANLHIIGTMNTADRSVEALDAALRRRFSFEEMPPKPELLSPGYLFWDLLWKYVGIGWEDKTYSSKERQLLDFLGASSKIWDERKVHWNNFKLEKKNVGQIKVFPIEEFSGINLEKILRIINQRIIKLLDKDHQIGHSYFISVTSLDQLKSTFQNKIIPLLQEYFFGDYGKIGLVLGGGFFEPEETTEENLFADFADYDASGFAERNTYNFKDISKMADEDFYQAINYLLKN